MDKAKQGQGGRPEMTKPEAKRDDFAARLMGLKGNPGQKRLSTWQQSGHKRFNAHGCQ